MSDTPDFEIDLGLDEIKAEKNADDIEIDLGLTDDDATQEDEVITLADDEDESDEPSDVEEATAKALAELHEDLLSKHGDWYVVHTYSGMENRVKQNIENRTKTFNQEDYIFEVVVPTEDVVEIRNNARKTVTRSVLPGYVLVRMDLDENSWSTVRQTPSVTGFVGHAQTPIPLSLDEVERMLTPSIVAKVAAETAGKPVRKKIEVVDFAVGDSVQVVDGPFTGVHATITEINVNSQRLKALVEILGRETPVDLEFRQVERAV